MIERTTRRVKDGGRSEEGIRGVLFLKETRQHAIQAYGQTRLVVLFALAQVGLVIADFSANFSALRLELSIFFNDGCNGTIELERQVIQQTICTMDSLLLQEIREPETFRGPVCRALQPMQNPQRTRLNASNSSGNYPSSMVNRTVAFGNNLIHHYPQEDFVKSFTNSLQPIFHNVNFGHICLINDRHKIMKTHLPFLTAIALAVTVPGLFAADVTGKVTLKGTPPPELTIKFEPVNCGPLHPTPVTTRHYVVAPDGGLANVFVYIKSGLTGKTFEQPKDTPVIDQLNCMYEPYVMGVMTNQKFKARNSDTFLHNVHPTPKVAGNKEDNKAQPGKGMETEFSFPKQEVLLKFACNVHPWMFAYVGVMEHPYFAVTGKDGTFKIPNLPPGKYTIEAYHLKTHGANPGMTQEITVDGDKKVDFTIELKAP